MKTFSSIFFRNEYKELVGLRNSVIKRLVLLLSLTLAALGFAIGGLGQLKARMDNPFTNWVDMAVSLKVEKKLPALRNHFSEQDSLNKYHLESIGNWAQYFLSFHHRDHDPIAYRKDSLAYIQMGRTIEFDGALFKEIINGAGKNLLYWDTSAMDKAGNVTWPCGIIVTEAVMKKLGYDPTEYASVKHISVNLEQGGVGVFLRLLGVVKQLPSFSDFVTTKRVYSIAQGDFGEYVLRNSPSDSTEIRLMSYEPRQRTELEQKAIADFGTEEFDLKEDSLRIDANRLLYTYIIRINSNPPRAQKVQDFIKSHKKDKLFADFSDIECGDDADVIENPHSLSFNFIDLDEIRPFQQMLSLDHDIEFTMEQVESRENFRLVTRLTTIMGTVLFGFGLLSILLYLGNLIHSHVLKIKTNLGTFKAMGLQNSSLIRTYTNIVLKLLVVSLLISLPCAFLLGWGLNQYWLKVGFSFIHWSIPCVISLIFLVTYFLIRLILKKILIMTPGDLIYERLADE